MSDDLDCEGLRETLARFLDGECVEAEADEIRRHLDACEACVEDADVALALKALVKRCCRPAPAPEEFRTRIVMTYRSVTYTRTEGDLL